MRFSGRRSDGVKATTASKVGGVIAFMVAIFFSVLAVLSCPIGEITGMQQGIYEQPSCSRQCGCSSESYGFTPVCAVDSSATYFSPCHAGCEQYEDLNGYMLFHNCTCGGARAVRGACTLNSCRIVFSVYQILFAVVLALTAASLLMQGMVVLRAVRRSDKPAAVGAAFGAIALLTHAPAHLLYMLISHLTCAHSTNVACVVHSPTLWSMPATSAVFSLVSAVLSLSASRVASNDAVKLTDQNS